MKLTPQLLNRLAGWKAVKEGRQLFDLGKVSDISFDGVFLQGIVRAGPGGVMKVRLKTGSRELDFENYCSCPMAQSTGGAMCAHAMAVAWAFIEGAKADKTPDHTKATAPVSQRDESNNVNFGREVPGSRKKLINRIPFEEADEQTPTLSLRVILPSNLNGRFGQSARAQTFEVQPFIEGSIEERAFQPLQFILRQTPNRVAVSDSNEKLLSFLEETGALNGQLPPLDLAKLDRLFLALRGHDEVWLGRSCKVDILGRDVPRVIQVSAPEGKCIEISAADTPPPGRRIGAWYFDGTTLRRRASPAAGLPESGSALFSGEKARAFIEEVFLRETPGVSFKLATSFKQYVRISRTSPRIRIDLDGTQENLQARLFAVYDGMASPIFPTGPLRAGVRQLDSGKLAFVYGNPAVEEQARSRLLGCGFLPGKHDRTLFVLPGEGFVMPFLANEYPDIERDWILNLSQRFARTIAQAEWVRPTLDIREWDTNARSGRGVSGVDWFATVSFESESGKGGLPYTEAFELLNRGRVYVRRPDGRLLLVRRNGFEDLQQALADFDARQDRPGAVRFSKRHTLALTGLLASGQVALKRGSPWAPPETLSTRREIQPPPQLNLTLRPYQLEGFRWLVWLSENELAGILGDEMGLGKTIQTLAWLLHRRTEASAGKPQLVVCPGSLLFNWMTETRRYAAELKPVLYHGADRDINKIIEGEAELWITSYGVLRRDASKLEQIHFDAVVLDEAQQIKNPQGKAASAARSLQATCRLALTGTPVENRPMDLWSIFEFLMPGYLGRAKDFVERYGKPVERQGQESAAVLERLARRIRPFFLRRTKATVAPELPERVDREVLCALSPLQRELHDSLLSAAKRGLSDLAGEKDQGRRRMIMLRAILRLRQICCHPALLPEEFFTARKKVEKKSQRVDSAEAESAGDSGKLAAFLELLDEALESSQRLLVFSQFTSMLAILRTELDGRRVPYCYLDGATRDREAPVREFQSETGPPVFLISLKAGGTGLNLTAADHVVLFDPWWNPAVEEQAAARAHRIGRAGMVTVHRLIAADTIEAGILKLQRHKRSVTESLIGSGDAGQGLSTAEIEEVLRNA